MALLPQPVQLKALLLLCSQQSIPCLLCISVAVGRRSSCLCQLIFTFRELGLQQATQRITLAQSFTAATSFHLLAPQLHALGEGTMQITSCLVLDSCTPADSRMRLCA
jgi:hypothetical protein